LLSKTKGYKNAGSPTQICTHIKSPTWRTSWANLGTINSILAYYKKPCQGQSPRTSRPRILRPKELAVSYCFSFNFFYKQPLRQTELLGAERLIHQLTNFNSSPHFM
jgi:hypothetical protein